MRFLFKYPSRGRPDWFRQTLAAYYSKLSGQHPFRFIVTMDDDDPSMNNALMRNWLNGQKNLSYDYSHHANKIQACNAGMDEDFDVLVLVSDDMTPVVQGFDAVIAEDMQREFPGFDGALHYNDGFVSNEGRDLMTLSILGREFYRKIGFIYWPAYQGTWCDNETMELAKKWERYWFSPRTIIRHDWQRNEQYKGDAVYRKGDSTYQQDRDTYHWRKSKGFPVKFSQSDEDWVIRRYFKDEYKGRFLDIGAADGVTFSNTRVLYDMGWNGVAVEPSRHFCSKFYEVYVELAQKSVLVFDRNRVQLVEKALMPADGPVELYESPDFISTTNEQHRAKWQGQTTYQKVGRDGISWVTLLAEYGSDFDFINLDIEGESARMFYFMPVAYKQRARMICIEYDDGLVAIQQDLQRHGFRQLYASGENVIMGK